MLKPTKMEIQNIRQGEKMFCKGPCTIENITNNAVILLRHAANPEMAVMNLDITQATAAFELVRDFVKEYFDHASLEDDVFLSNTEALVVGGEFREHMMTADGRLVVHVHYDMARKAAEEALQVCGLTPKYAPADNDPQLDRRMTKRLEIGEDRSVKVTGRLEGLNSLESVMSSDSYAMTIGRYQDS
jgi:hypothetical protein